MGVHLVEDRKIHPNNDPGDAPAIGRNGPRRNKDNAPVPASSVRRGLADALASYRRLHDLSVSDMSAQLHIKPERLALIERGVLRTYTLHDVDAMMKALGLVQSRVQKTPSRAAIHQTKK
jgi:hypothetical protein